MQTKILLLAGINNSGFDHWQSIWQRENPSYLKLQHTDWDAPDCRVWVQELEDALGVIGDTNITLVAHSLACLLVAHWAQTTKHQIKSAILVSVPDATAASFPPEAKNFAHIPLKPFKFPSIVVSSTNDPYSSSSYMQDCADAWGSQFISVGALGHINAGSHINDWPQGKGLLSDISN